MVAAAEGHAAQLLDPQAAPLRAVLGRELLEVDDAVGEALQLQVGRVGGAVVEEDDRAAAAGEELLQGQDLAPVAQRVAGQQPHLGEGVEDDPRRLDLLHDVEDALRGLVQLDLGGVEEGVVALQPLLAGRQLVEADAVEGPAVGAGDRRSAPSAVSDSVT